MRPIARAWFVSQCADRRRRSDTKAVSPTSAGGSTTAAPREGMESLRKTPSPHLRGLVGGIGWIP